ncbi:MAG: phage holin, LLH family [Chloroflexota bacterium]|nr:phage holin, LLH family [Chloroflexota bacterium]
MKFLKFMLFAGLVIVLLTSCTPEGQIIPELQGPISMFIQSLIEILVLPLLVMLLTWAYAQVRMAWQRFKEKNPDQAYWISYVIQTVVQAAEQTAEAYPDDIEDKKAWAIERAEAWFEQLGIELDVGQISDLIEAEVKALFNSSPVVLPSQDIHG